MLKRFHIHDDRYTMNSTAAVCGDMGLAQKRIKQRIPSDPRNTKWTKETNGFGFKMLEKMGWKAGTGLGTREQGIALPLIPTIHESTEGIGMKEIRSEREEKWKSNLHSYDAMLRSMSSKISIQQTISTEPVKPDTCKRLFHKKSIQAKSSIYNNKNRLENILGIKNSHSYQN